MKENFEKEFDTVMKQALLWKTECIEPSQELLQNMKAEIREQKKENGFMKKNMKQILAVAAVCVLSVTCYAATQLNSVVSSSTPNIATFAELQKAEKKLDFDAKYVESFTNGMTFQYSGIGEVQGMDADGKTIGTQYQMLTISYADETGKQICLDVENGSPYVDAGMEEAKGYSSQLYKFVPPDYEKTEEDIAKEEAGEMTISYGAQTVELKQAESYYWEDAGVYYSLVGFDCDFGEDAMKQMAKEVMAQ